MNRPLTIPTRRRPISPGKILLREFLVEQCCLRGLRIEGRQFLHDVVIVAAAPRAQLPAIELDNARRQPLKEGAIVGHEHDGSRVLGEKRLQPGDRL